MAKRVLLADDDPVLRGLLVRALEAAGFEVLVAVDAPGFLAHVAESGNLEDDFALIVTDVNMPFGSGLELLDGVHRTRLDVPTIVMTGDPNELVRRRAEALGAVLMPKPFAPSDLVARARELTRGRDER